MRSLAAVCALAALPVLAGCSSPAPAVGGFKAETPKVQSRRLPTGQIDDRSMCEYKGKADREASETAGPGSIQPNVRRVYALIGTGEDRQKVLICREIDTNFDGVKDVVRHYNDKGESLREEADSNFDGVLDTWITFAKGHLAEVKIDTNRDGKPDEWKYYSGGKLARVKRDTNFDSRPDIWEIYRDGHLERMGVDIDGDERVDRWDHDNEQRRKLEAAERKKEEEAAAAAEKKKAEAEKAAADAQAAEEAKDAEPEKTDAGP
ncbi:MAG: hypothetical protein R3B70_13840 [Polyangiaceae bacterium]